MNYPVSRPDAQAYADSIAVEHSGVASADSGKSRTLWGDALGRPEEEQARGDRRDLDPVHHRDRALRRPVGAPRSWATRTRRPPTWPPSRALPPSLEHPFGTDTLGRDVLSRVIYGARISLTVGVVATGISTAIGLVMGAIAAYYGGIWDTIIMRLADIFLAFPYTLSSSP